MNAMNHRMAILSVVILAEGCRHVPVPEATGRSSFTFVESPSPPPNSNVKVTESTTRSQYREATLQQPASLPIYPARALKGKAGRAIVGVHITVDTAGRVSTIDSSLFVFSTPGPYAEDFRDAVEAALRQWKFAPARVEYVEAINENESTYNRVTRSETIETEFDLSFAFSADGCVRTE